MKQSALLERLSKEKPAHEIDSIGEALRRGYSVQQIVKAMDTEMNKTEARQGKIKYSSTHKSFEVPYT
ncbi:MAG: hypothetical protein IJS35_04240, partial [Firmicutes bacterium]|nr:hypothetical protein [Bacillota bacterium]